MPEIRQPHAFQRNSCNPRSIKSVDGEVIVSQHRVGSLLGHIGAGDHHRPDTGGLARGDRGLGSDTLWSDGPWRGMVCSVVMRLRSDSNGTSATRGKWGYVWETVS